MKGAFEKAYGKLNDRQKEAVDAVDGPVMVIAGPGTGKTQVLTLRIANIMRVTDTEARSILALTFTEKAAFTMRSRLAELIGPTAYGVRISTFHAFCNEVIGRNPDSFPRLMNGTPLADGEQLGLIEALLESDDILHLRPAGKPQMFVKDIIGSIGDIKGKGFVPVQFDTAVAEARRELGTDAPDSAVRKGERMGELALLYTRYQAELDRTNRYDYADMLSEVAGALERERDLLLDLSERYQYILVDEHQDTNRTQNRIVQLLTEHGGPPNLFVVGDLEQAIYRFQGASPENFREFAKRYRSCRVIRLDENYRSSQAILDAALGISPTQGALAAKAGHASDPVRLLAMSSLGAMEHAAAKLALEAMERGSDTGDIAVLYRTNREADGLAASFEALGVPFAVQSDTEVLGDPVMMQLVAVARAAHRIGDDGPLLEALQTRLLGVTPLDGARIGRYARDNRMSAWDIIRTPRLLAKLPAEDAPAVLRASALLKELAQTLPNTDALSGLQAVVEATGWTARALNLARGHEALARLHALYDAVRAFTAGMKRARLGDFLDALERMERHGEDFSALAQQRPDAVQLLTVHKAKGLEFTTVIIVNAVRGHWDDARKPPSLPLPPELVDDDPGEDDADMRRLFYVAVTRARRDLCILWSQRTPEGKDLQPSRFVLAIPDALAERADTAPYEESYVRHYADSAVSRAREPALQQREYIAALLERQPLSVTALNNFIACPWRYYFVNLVRIPEAAFPKSEYGKAAHAALRNYFDAVAVGGSPSRAALVASFRTLLNRAPLAPHITAQLVREGTDALNGWHAFWSGSWITRVRNEVQVERVMLGDIPLTGALDKVEFLPSGRVSVVDYKTKAPMSGNAIKGLTKNTSGNEYRQLLFYKILLDRWEAPGARGARWNMESGQIDFLEPNDSGKYKKELFPVDTAMTRDLEEVIREMVSEVRTLGFWNRRCGERDCRYCRLRAMME